MPKGFVNENFFLESPDAGATPGPLVDLYRNSASPIANDFIGGHIISGENSGGAKYTYAQHSHQIITTTAASEDGRYLLQVSDGGTLRDVIDATAGHLSINGTIDATSPPSGAIGEVIEIASGIVSITSGVAFELTNITLTPGIWELEGLILFDTNGIVAGNVDWLAVIASTTLSLTPITSVGDFGFNATGGADAPKPISAISSVTLFTGRARVQISVNTQYFLNGRGTASTTFTGVRRRGTFKAIRVA